MLCSWSLGLVSWFGFRLGLEALLVLVKRLTLKLKVNVLVLVLLILSWNLLTQLQISQTTDSLSSHVILAKYLATINKEDLNADEQTNVFSSHEYPRSHHSTVVQTALCACNIGLVERVLNLNLISLT